MVHKKVKIKLKKLNKSSPNYKKIYYQKINRKNLQGNIQASNHKTNRKESHLQDYRQRYLTNTDCLIM